MLINHLANFKYSYFTLDPKLKHKSTHQKYQTELLKSWFDLLNAKIRLCLSSMIYITIQLFHFIII